jgi:carboxyl-terminal processing protease
MCPRRGESWTFPLVLVLVLLAAFITGALVERVGLLPGSPNWAPAHVGPTFHPFWEAWNLAEEHYVDKKALDPEKMTHGAIEGMLDALGDVGHTGFVSSENLQALRQSLEGKFEGIGARMTVRKNQPTVAETFPGSPARKAGLKPGDILLEVDAKPVAGLPIDKVAALVRGPAGTPVHLRAARGEGNTKVLEFSITRAKVDIPVVAWTLLPGTKVAHVAVREFATNADSQLRAAVAAARAQGATGLIVDIRGNPGGLKEQAVNVTSEFLKDGTVFIEQDAKGKRTSVPVQPGGVATDLPLVVLIDQGSASSSEIFAGAIQDHHRGKLVGTKTFGTGTVLQPFPLSDGSAVMLAVAQWFTPDGRQIWHKGIEPDVEVKMPETAALLMPDEVAELTAEQFARADDVQLRRALDVLRGNDPGKAKAKGE